MPMSNSQRRRMLKSKALAAAAAGGAERHTAFRRAEKRYMSRVPEPDYSEVIDLHGDGLERFAEHVTAHSLLADLFGLEDFGSKAEGSCRTVYELKDHPGAILIPGALSGAAQRRIVREILRDTARPPNASNLDTHYVLPPEGLWNAHERQVTAGHEQREPLVATKHSVLSVRTTGTAPDGRCLIQSEAATMATRDQPDGRDKSEPAASGSVLPEPASSLLYKFRWTNLGLLYHWSTKSYHFEDVLRPDAGKSIAVPPRLARISQQLLRAVPPTLVPRGQNWQRFEPEAGIVNYYQLRSTLMGHVDHAELVEDAPLVSLSIGHAAVFLLGGTTRETPPTAVMLRSGDALIMSGGCRRAFHGVPRIVEGSLPAYLQDSAKWSDGDVDKSNDAVCQDWRLFANYLATTRININVRQVFPHGFLERRRREWADGDTRSETV